LLRTLLLLEGIMKWFLYVLRCNDDTLYTGITTDPKRRLREHNTNNRGAKYTNSRRPSQLVYCEEYSDRSSAQKAEHAFKKLTREQKEKIINI